MVRGRERERDAWGRESDMRGEDEVESFMKRGVTP